MWTVGDSLLGMKVLRVLQSAKSVRLGWGGVYLVQSAAEAPVVVKVCNNSEALTTKAMCQAAQHPSISRVKWFPGRPQHNVVLCHLSPHSVAVCFEFIPDTLSSAVRRLRASADAQSFHTLVRAWQEYAVGLHEMHCVGGWAHTDVCPDNLGLRQDGSGALLDFGLIQRLYKNSLIRVPTCAPRRTLYASISQQRRVAAPFLEPPEAPSELHAMDDFEALFYTMLRSMVDLLATPIDEEPDFWKALLDATQHVIPHHESCQGQSTEDVFVCRSVSVRYWGYRPLTQHEELVLLCKQQLPQLLQSGVSPLHILPTITRRILQRMHQFVCVEGRQRCAPNEPLPSVVFDQLLSLISELVEE